MPDVSTKKYRLMMQNGQERTIVMPQTWRITFGPNVPGAPRVGYRSENPQAWCFRVYSTNPKMLKCCLPSVVEFFEEDSFTMEILDRDPASTLITTRTTLGNDQHVTNRRVANQAMFDRAMSHRPSVHVQDSISWSDHVASLPDSAILGEEDR